MNRIDWPAVVRALLGRISSGAIADIIYNETGIRKSPQSIRAMAGKGWKPHYRPGYEEGCVLLNLHRELCNDAE